MASFSSPPASLLQNSTPCQSREASTACLTYFRFHPNRFPCFISKRPSFSLHNALAVPRSSLRQPVEPWEDPNGALTSVNGNGLTVKDEEFSKTLRLVETAMLAAAVGLAYFLSNLLRIENYFGCFFPLPLVISAMRWGAAAGRKTMVATAILLLVLSGPLRAASYLLMHGFVGLAMGTLWRSKIRWGTSVFLCTLVRSLGAMGFLFLSSWLLRDNLLALITINAHASISFMLAAVGINIVPSMGSIYFIFGTLVLLNCGSFVFLLHVLYAIFLRRLGLNPSLIFPAWLKAL